MNKINLLIPEIEAENHLKEKVKGYDRLLQHEQFQYRAPYVQTTLLIYELINLEYEAKGTTIRVFEKTGMRKDRYSSLAYNYWVQCQLEREMLRKPKSGFDALEYANKLGRLNKKPNMY